MYDRFNRNINYLRVSITDRCNLRCQYCMPECGVKLIKHSDILSFEEIVEFVRFGVDHGIRKVRLTGGEPLVRRGVVDLVAMLAKISGLKELAMTTNGTFLDQFAQPLAKAGLDRVNISLDTMKPETYHSITRVGDISNVMNGIEAAKKAGLYPIKINCVIRKSSMEPDAQAVAAFCNQNNLKIRFIKEMDLETGIFDKVIGGEGGDCKICNRLRLTADGKLKPCLFSDLEFDIKALGIEEAYRKAIGMKPRSGKVNKNSRFSNIGG